MFIRSCMFRDYTVKWNIVCIKYRYCTFMEEDKLRLLCLTVLCLLLYFLACLCSFKQMHEPLWLLVLCWNVLS